MKSDHNLAWNFVSEADAQKGLDNKKYYVSLTIPANFSVNIYSVDGANPTKAQLIYKSREATNYLATTITNSVVTRVAEALSHKTTAKYFDNIFVSLKGTAADLVKAEDASTLLVNGLVSASYGSSQLETGLTTAATGSQTIVSGLTTLNNGQTSLTSGLSEAVSGTNKLQLGANNISLGLTQVETGLSGTVSALNSVNQGITQSQSALTNASSILSAYIATHPESAAELGSASQLIAGANTGLTTTNGGVLKISTGVSSLSAGVSAANVGEKQLSTGLTTLSTELTKAEAGSSSLATGSEQLITGATDLSLGLTTLQTGATTLTSGLTQAKDGMIQLRDKLAQGATKASAETSSSKVASETAVMSSPITLTTKSYDKVANYGSGFAPYFIALALWVGALLSFFVVDFSKKPESKTEAFAKYLILALLGLAQAIILAFVLQHILGLSVANVWQYYGFVVFISLSFMALLQLLIQHLGDVGRYLAVVLLMLQLTSAAGTFPLETLPKFFQVINPYLPMTYCVNGLRDILFSKNLSGLNFPLMYFSLLLIGSLLLNFLLTKNRPVKTVKKTI